MWTPVIAEEMFSPYYALEHIDQETMAMDYPSGFACIVLSQKTHKDTRWSCYQGTWWLCVRRLFLLKQQPRHFFLNKYNVSLEKAQYLYWITRRHRFAVASTVSTDVLYDQRSVTFHPRYLMLRLFKIILHLWGSIMTTETYTVATGVRSSQLCPHYGLNFWPELWPVGGLL